MQISSNNSFTLGQTIMKKDKKSIGFQASKKPFLLTWSQEENFFEYIFVFTYGSDFEYILRCFGSRSALNKPVHTKRLGRISEKLLPLYCAPPLAKSPRRPKNPVFCFPSNGASFLRRSRTRLPLC